MSRVGAILVAFSLVAMLLPGAVLAAAPTVTSATGGEEISADTFFSGTYTTLSGPSIVVAGAGDLTTGTVTLTAPAGFEFATGAPSPSISAGATGATVSFTSATLSVVTFTVTSANTAAGTLVISGVRVRPTAGNPLASGQLQVGGGSSVSDATAGLLNEVPGAPILEFSTQPSSTVTAGVAFPTQPIVTSVDRFDNPRENDAVILSIRPGTGTAGAVLSCTPSNTVNTNAGGVAAFAGCKIDKAGTGYRLRASVTGATSIDSNTITVNPGDPVKIGFVTQPARGIPNVAFASQPVVAIQDAQGNTVPTAGATTVTLALTTGTGTLTCTGGLSKGTSQGVASFTGCRLNQVGVGFKITATAVGYATPVESTAFDVADRLGFTTQPSASTSAGVAFASQPVVAVRAGASNTAVNDQATVVTLSLKAGSGATGGVLTCDGGLSKTAVNGLATFSGCKIDKVSPTSPANPYVIVASASGLTSAESSNVAIIAGPAAKLGFTAQPTAATVNQAFPIQPVVAIQDLGGNTVTTGAFATSTVTLAIGTNPGGGTLTCTGGLTKVAVAGVATFSGCQINNAGVGYTLTASVPGLTGATSTAFNVSAPAASITLTTSAPISPGGWPTITWGGGILLTTQFGVNGGNKTFKMQATRDNVTWFDIGPLLTTDAAGRATFVFRPSTNFFYRAVFAGTPDLSAGVSNSVRTVVRQIALLRPTNSGAVKEISRNTSVTFTTTVRPSRPELVPATVTYFLYRLSGSTWVLSTQRTLTADAAGLASTTFTFSTTGEWYVRSQANPTTYNANSVMSPVERYSVR
jgi:hypothetical protein